MVCVFFVSISASAYLQNGGVDFGVGSPGNDPLLGIGDEVDKDTARGLIGWLVHYHVVVGCRFDPHSGFPEVVAIWVQRLWQKRRWGYVTS